MRRAAALLEGVEDAIKVVARSRGLEGLNANNKWVTPGAGDDFSVLLADYFDVCAGAHLLLERRCGAQLFPSNLCQCCSSVARKASAHCCRDAWKAAAAPMRDDVHVVRDWL